MTYHGISIEKAYLNDFCKKNHIKKLSFFGSILNEKFTDTSDIDILIEFENHHSAGLLKMASLESELSQLLGRQVDLRTAAELSRYFRNDVLTRAQVQYAQR